MESRQYRLTPAQGKQLIALALAQEPEVREAMKEHRVLVVAGTTNAFLAQALLEQLGETGFDGRHFFRGAVSARSVPAEWGAFQGDVVIERGRWMRGQSIENVIGDLCEGDLIFKGANAVHLPSRECGVLAGNPTSGTLGDIYCAAVGRRVRVISPVGVEKRVEEPIADLHWVCGRAGAQGLRLAPSVGQAYTELDAIRSLSGAQAHLIAAGGILGCEGCAFFQCEGTEEQLEALDEWMTRVDG